VHARARTSALALLVALAGSLTVLVASLEAAPSKFVSCPGSDRTVAHPQAPGAGGELVPTGTTGVLLCRYRGLNPSAKRFRLIASDNVSRASTVAHLRAELDALRPSTGVFACPFDSNALIVAYFHYTGASDDVITVDTSGCELVSNGRVRRTASLAPGPQLVRELEALTRRAELAAGAPVRRRARARRE
jgi:hypothetical protein